MDQLSRWFSQVEPHISQTGVSVCSQPWSRKRYGGGRLKFISDSSGRPLPAAGFYDMLTVQPNRLGFIRRQVT